MPLHMGVISMWLLKSESVVYDEMSNETPAAAAVALLFALKCLLDTIVY